MPDTGDTDFSWREFVRRNNDELVATYGNLVNRVLTFVYKNFDGGVPEHSKYSEIREYLDDLAKDMRSDYLGKGVIDDRSVNMIEDTKMYFKEVGIELSRCHFKQAIMKAMYIAHEANRYLDEKSPWKVIKEDKKAAADSLYVTIYVISQLKTMLYPFLPFSSQKLHEFLGFTGSVEKSGWQLHSPLPGQKLLPPEPLFAKLDDSLVEEETARLGHTLSS